MHLILNSAQWIVFYMDQKITPPVKREKRLSHLQKYQQRLTLFYIELIQSGSYVDVLYPSTHSAHERKEDKQEV